MNTPRLTSSRLKIRMSDSRLMPAQSRTMAMPRFCTASESVACSMRNMPIF
eukprot:CAMPEP_0170630478 /NCGR_PEP_ID=MMETSP0224-20130122/34021_1 /TAXON_ID=285029 /ORGANISM="Togula jolla, Strain CCCM 725" /LENGTH=50 /DNA_ID=CAMNT_0010958537 /DNA_START=308 /DNA_END=460 /DNA_ORIENTATION=+